MWTKIKEGAAALGVYALQLAWAYPAVGHGVAAAIAVIVGALMGVPTHVAAAVAAFYWGRELTQAKIWVKGLDARPISDWSKNPDGLRQAIVPTVVAIVIAGSWLWLF
jgi:hypothetical protein